AYDRLYFEVILSRNLGFYLMNIIIPSMLIVSISWVSFWVSREASPARVGLGTMTVLTMTTLITTTNNSMPKVSYIKGLDVFLNFCFVMVFASLVEYAIVSYTGKRMLRRKEKYRKRPNRPTLTSYPTTPNGGLAVPPSPKFIYPSNGTPTFSLDGDIRKPLHAQMSNGSSVHQPMHCPQSGWAKPVNSYCKVFSPSRIDHCSRSVFPLLFIGFNVVYWSIMTALSGREASEFDFVAFQEEI
ncbi:unc-49B protein, partial [Aphelenchoides avenae]